eukprot:gene16919-19283_t
METETIPEEVHFVVGGYHYYLDADDLLEHPESYFAHMLKDEWNKDKTAAVTIDRNGYMDPNRKPIYDLDALRTEADFYGLPELVSISDSLESYHGNVAALLQSEQKRKYFGARKCSFAHRCFMMSGDGFSDDTKSKLFNAFSEWPCMTTDRVSRAYVQDPQVYIYETGGSCAGRVPFAQNSYHDGTFLYIFNSEHTGGRITTKVNGEEVSIEKAGECMALLPGCSYSVETVTSGYLVLFQYTVRIAKDYGDTNSDDGDRDVEGAGEGDSGMQDNEGEIFEDEDVIGTDVKNPLEWQVRDSYSTKITPTRSAALTHAINTALESYAGVVICLSTYYPAGHSTNTTRRCETDPALLKKCDAKLHAHLSTNYEVTVVTVTVAANTADEGGGSTARVLDFPQEADMQLKVVAPMQSVSSDKGKTKTMLLTGLLCFLRSSEKV